MVTHREAPILVVSFIPVVGSDFNEDLTYYYYPFTKGGDVIEKQFILDDTLRRLKSDLVSVRDKDSLWHLKKVNGQEVVMLGNDAIFIMMAKTSCIINQED